MSCARTRSALKSLPFDYEEIGGDRYGVTWSILNMYENYAAARDAFLEMEEGAPDYLDRLYTIYRVQGYLATHAGRLEQMTVQSGNERYEMQRPLFIIVPAVSILWGLLLNAVWLSFYMGKNFWAWTVAKAPLKLLLVPVYGYLIYLTLRGLQKSGLEKHL